MGKRKRGNRWRVPTVQEVKSLNLAKSLGVSLEPDIRRLVLEYTDIEDRLMAMDKATKLVSKSVESLPTTEKTLEKVDKSIMLRYEMILLGRATKHASKALGTSA